MAFRIRKAPGRPDRRSSLSATSVLRPLHPADSHAPLGHAAPRVYHPRDGITPHRPTPRSAPPRRIVAPRPNITAGRTEFVYTRPMTGLPQGDSPFLLDSSYTITADVTVPDGGAEGMILTSGGRFAGYGFYLLKGKPVFLWNLIDLKRVKWEGPDALAPGKHILEFDFKYDGLGLGTLAFNNMSGLGRGGTGTLKVDGQEVQTITLPHTLPMILQWDESFDVGSDTLTGVNDADYQPPFPLTAKLNKLTIQVDRPKLTPEDVKTLENAEATALDGKPLHQKKGGRTIIGSP